MVIGTARRGLERGMGMPLTGEQRRQRHELMFGGNPGGPIRGYWMELRSWFRARPMLREFAKEQAERFLPQFARGKAERAERAALF